jgi:hypothetical protein
MAATAATLVGAATQAWRYRRRALVVLGVTLAVALVTELVLAAYLAYLSSAGSLHVGTLALLAIAGLFGPFLALRSARAARRAGWPTVAVFVRSALVGVVSGLLAIGLLLVVAFVVAVASL